MGRARAWGRAGCGDWPARALPTGVQAGGWVEGGAWLGTVCRRGMREMGAGVGCVPFVPGHRGHLHLPLPPIHSPATRCPRTHTPTLGPHTPPHPACRHVPHHRGQLHLPLPSLGGRGARRRGGAGRAQQPRQGGVPAGAVRGGGRCARGAPPGAGAQVKQEPSEGWRALCPRCCPRRRRSNEAGVLSGAGWSSGSKCLEAGCWSEVRRSSEAGPPDGSAGWRRQGGGRARWGGCGRQRTGPALGVETAGPGVAVSIKSSACLVR